ncbi:hypothetical protein HK103_003240 [Boothiomyces macroporosus]|uniref:HNH nuclease domain-containing protein n=1 Tax=Boothiomyces macroporosus TaxID=261099 RepID=A0AAD5UIR1_9FUNG|nr:hypothetical protein HK103_003240 [Boothiomyces macroporosus]
MDIRSRTKQKLKECYAQLDENVIPESRKRGKWELSNKLGFLLGIILEGLEEDVQALYELLNKSQEEVEKELELSPENLLKSTLYTPTFIDRLFNFYIAAFHKNYSDNESCHTPASSRPSSAESITKEPKEQSSKSTKEPQELTHTNLRDSVKKRDGVCLFCWNIKPLDGAHIISQKIAVSNDENAILTRCGLQHKHQIQNGLLLCKNCHDSFDQLKSYVDEVDGRLVVKIVNEANDTTSDKHAEWVENIDSLKAVRATKKRRFPNREIMDKNGEMPLYFVNNDESIQPNRAALAFHKTACLIWRMAGGADTEDEECWDDEPGPVNTAELKQRFNISDSDATLHPVSCTATLSFNKFVNEFGDL